MIWLEELSKKYTKKWLAVSYCWCEYHIIWEYDTQKEAKEHAYWRANYTTYYAIKNPNYIKAIK